jgi:hypothetical protein
MGLSVDQKGWILRGLLLACLAASLLHFVHNAEYVQDYPNLPGWISRSSVYLVWMGITAVGITGYLLYRAGRHTAGLLLLGVYAAAGLDGLLHYTRAPMTDHSHAMNFTIWFEVALAGVLLLYVAALGRLHWLRQAR